MGLLLVCQRLVSDSVDGDAATALHSNPTFWLVFLCAEMPYEQENANAYADFALGHYH